jgi:hypothetical protein
MYLKQIAVILSGANSSQNGWIQRSGATRRARAGRRMTRSNVEGEMEVIDFEVYWGGALIYLDPRSFSTFYKRPLITFRRGFTSSGISRR